MLELDFELPSNKGFAALLLFLFFLGPKGSFATEEYVITIDGILENQCDRGELELHPPGPVKMFVSADLSSFGINPLTGWPYYDISRANIQFSDGQIIEGLSSSTLYAYRDAIDRLCLLIEVRWDGPDGWTVLGMPKVLCPSPVAEIEIYAEYEYPIPKFNTAVVDMSLGGHSGANVGHCDSRMPSFSAHGSVYDVLSEDPAMEPEDYVKLASAANDAYGVLTATSVTATTAPASFAANFGILAARFYICPFYNFDQQICGTSSQVRGSAPAGTLSVRAPSGGELTIGTSDIPGARIVRTDFGFLDFPITTAELTRFESGSYTVTAEGAGVNAALVEGMSASSGEIAIGQTVPSNPNGIIELQQELIPVFASRFEQD